MATKNKKRTVTDTCEDVSPYELEGTLAAIRGKIQGYIDLYGATARLEWDSDFHYSYQDNPSPRYLIKRDREESDDEFEDRVEKEKRARTDSERKEYAEYERLQAKFGRKK